MTCKNSADAKQKSVKSNKNNSVSMSDAGVQNVKEESREYAVGACRTMAKRV
jgi:hypothetical protein